MHAAFKFVTIFDTSLTSFVKATPLETSTSIDATFRFNSLFDVKMDGRSLFMNILLPFMELGGSDLIRYFRKSSVAWRLSNTAFLKYGVTQNVLRSRNRWVTRKVDMLGFCCLKPISFCMALCTYALTVQENNGRSWDE